MALSSVDLPALVAPTIATGMPLRMALPVLKEWVSCVSLCSISCAKAGIIAGGYDPVYGARPLKRYLQKTVETLCAKLILANSVAPGDTILIDDTGNGLTAVRQTD